MKTERDDRSILYEKILKRYQSLPLPKITYVKMYVDLYPDKQQAFTKAFVTIVNKNTVPVKKLLLDAEELTSYSLKQKGRPIPFTDPLLYPRGIFNWFRPKYDTAEFRLYQFEKPLAPGDSAILEVNSSVFYNGFSNGLYAADMLRNGTFCAK
jgi:ABC-2 type transport system permease protein